MVYKDFQDLKLSALGMGTMRLPVIDGMMRRSMRPPLRRWWITPWSTV